MSDQTLLYQPALDALATAETVMLTAHVSPDGDAIGGLLALRHALAQRYPRLRRIDGAVSGGVPVVFDFIPGATAIRCIETDSDILEKYDVSISVDCGSLERLGRQNPAFWKPAAPLISIITSTTPVLRA